MAERNPICEHPCQGLTSLEGKVDGAIHTVVRLDREINGNGQPGVRQAIAEIRTVLSTIAAIEVHKEKVQRERHEENTQKLNEIGISTGRRTLLWTIAGVAVAIAATLVAMLAIYIGIRLSHQADLEKLFISHQSQVYDARKTAPQDAGLPSEFDSMRR